MKNIIAYLTERTCGEACWHAKDEVCHCSCYGKNHGCLRNKNGVKPDRHARIDGIVYKLEGVGDVYDDARRINQSAGYKAIEKPSKFTTSDGVELYSQYYYCWSVTDKEAPARVKNATTTQIKNWPELAAWRDGNKRPSLLWVRIEFPEKPKELRVSKQTGLPLVDQTPPLHW